jgi:HJR/Mrr/RecB family endonuclease
MGQTGLNDVSNLLAKGILEGFVKFFISLPWWIWVMLGLLILMKIFNDLVSQDRPRTGKRYDNQIELFLDNLFYFLFKRGKVIKSGISEIDRMSGRDFEFYLKKLFENLGYKATRVGTSYYDHRGDYGVDLIVEKKDGTMIAVQAKNYSKWVGIAAVREVLAGMQYYKCSKALVVTNNYFSNEARVQASVSNIVLWDRDKLIEVIAKL